MHLLSQVNWLAVAVTAIVTFALGALWYGPLFGKAWLSAVGLKKEELGSSSKEIQPCTYCLKSTGWRSPSPQS